MERVLSTRHPVKRRFISLDKIRTVAILFPADDEREYKLVMGFVKDLLKKQIQVRALGYVTTKNKPAFWQPSLYVNFLTASDISWDGRPKRAQLQDIAEAELDLLIDLNYRRQLPTTYLSAISRAEMRIGPAGPGHSKYYDMMIDTRKITTLEQYLAQIIHYLSTIKSVE